MPTNLIKAATADDEDLVISIIVLAFVDDPIGRWLFDNARVYLEHFPDFVRAFGGNAIANGTAFCTSNFAGTALWLPPNVQPDGERLMQVAQEWANRSALECLPELFESMDKFHPAEPHWYLPLMGVDPSQRGRGHGSALVEHIATQCDRDRTLAYLEATSPRNSTLYERHGFERIGTIQAGTSPAMIPMIQKPR